MQSGGNVCDSVVMCVITDRRISPERLELETSIKFWMLTEGSGPPDISRAVPTPSPNWSPSHRVTPAPKVLLTPVPNSTQTVPPPPPDSLHFLGNIRNNGIWAQAEAYPSTVYRRLTSGLKCNLMEVGLIAIRFALFIMLSPELSLRWYLDGLACLRRVKSKLTLKECIPKAKNLKKT